MTNIAVHKKIKSQWNLIMCKIKHKPKIATLKRKRDDYKKKKIRKLSKYLRSELGSSTTHGLPYIVNTRLHWSERFFWAACSTLSTAIIFFLISSQYAKYLAAPSIMSVEMDYFNWNVSFPAVTLCPINKIGDELRTDSIKDILKQTGQTLDVITPYLEAISLASLESINLLQTPAPELIPLINAKDYSMLAAKIFRKFDKALLSTNTDWPMSIETVMTEMGMCHVINSNVAVFDNPSKWNENGRAAYTKNSIELSFYDSSFFVNIMNYAESYKVYTQSPNDIILIGTPAGLPFDDEGRLSFGVQITSIKASPDLRAMALHMRKCRFVDEPDSRRYPVYSYNRCLMECRIRMIMILCGCIPHFYKPLDDEKVCNIAELSCLVDYQKQIAKFALNNETVSKFRNVTGLPKDFRDCNCLADCEPDFYNKDSEKFVPEDDMNSLKIVLAKFPKVRILREILFSFYDILLRSGSIVNLCIGSSMISAMELVMTLLRIPIYQITQLLTRA